MPAADFVSAVLRCWVGDVIGIGRDAVRADLLETRRIAVSRACAGRRHFGCPDARVRLWRSSRLPADLWMAVRRIEGASIGVLITELGLILGMRLFPAASPDLMVLQVVLLALALSGLVAGVLVTERNRAETQLRLHQESLSRLARLGSVGELAAAIAHEINQPLMAAGTYTRLVVDTIRTGHPDVDTVAETAMKAAAQVERAASVVRHLRALVRLDRSNRAACRVDHIVRETIDLCQPDLDRLKLSVSTAIAADLPPVMVDMLQIEHDILRRRHDAIREPH
jgi:signal transduction histidine kinase